MVNNHLRSALNENRFICSAELVLGRDHTVPQAETFVRDASQEPDGIKIISLTDLPSGGPALPPEAFVPFVLEHGLTPVPHLTGKDGNRSFVEARLHGLARMGAENVLALTGDTQHRGFQGEAKRVYDLDSVLILWLVQALRDGITYQMGPREVQTTPFDFFPGAVVSPYKCNQPDQMMQLYKLELKILLGARFVITQLGFNLRKLYELKQYMVREGLDHVPVLANIYVPTATIARMMRAGDISGCVAPEELIRRLEGQKKAQRLERAALTVAAVRDLGFAGAHIGGFGLKHRDFLHILDLSAEIGGGWRDRLDELVFSEPDEFYLLPEGADGLSDPKGTYNTGPPSSGVGLGQRLGRFAHDHHHFHRFGCGPVPATTTHHGGRWFGRTPGILAPPARRLHPVPQGSPGLYVMRRLHPGPPALCRLHDEQMLQGASQRTVWRFAHRRHLRGRPGSPLHLERGLRDHDGGRIRSPQVRDNAGPATGLVPRSDQRHGEPDSRARQRLPPAGLGRWRGRVMRRSIVVVVSEMVI